LTPTSHTTLFCSSLVNRADSLQEKSKTRRKSGPRRLRIGKTAVGREDFRLAVPAQSATEVAR
jgi:hypothetical protein